MLKNQRERHEQGNKCDDTMMCKVQNTTDEALGIWLKKGDTDKEGVHSWQKVAANTKAQHAPQTREAWPERRLTR